MEHDSDEPDSFADDFAWIPPEASVRHDGWTGERMANFCEVLANTGLVGDACLSVGMSRPGAYAARNRDPVFAAAWQAAEYIARSALSDGILTRSIEGSAERYYHDGVLVSERRYYESWLALRVLNRLDKRADFDSAQGALPARMAADWQNTLGALRSGGSCSVTALMAPDPAEIDKVDTPPSHSPRDVRDLSVRCWQDEDDGTWKTDFPPPAGFAGFESQPYDKGDGTGYWRECADEETAILEEHRRARCAVVRAQDEIMRDGWFEFLEVETVSNSSELSDLNDD